MDPLAHVVFVNLTLRNPYLIQELRVCDTYALNFITNNPLNTPLLWHKLSRILIVEILASHFNQSLNFILNLIVKVIEIVILLKSIQITSNIRLKSH